VTEGAADAMAAGRDLGLIGLPNARDLGGYPAADGSVREGLLLRTEALTNATPEDVAAIADLGVEVVIDLRGDSEIKTFGKGPWTGARAHLPTADLTQAIFTQMVKAGPDGEPLAEDEAVRVMIEMYRQFVFHCTAGKDRTGWLSAIVLTALGVDRESVIADYLLTNERAAEGRGAESRAKLLALLRQMVGERQPVAPLLDVRREYLQAAFDEAEARYGSMDAFLREGLGADVERLRATLVV